MDFKKLCCAFFLSLLSIKAHASFIDTDIYCVSYGCVVVSDHNSSDVYDVYNLSNYTIIPSGGQLIPSDENPMLGNTPVIPLLTNTTNNVSDIPADKANRLTIINPIGGGSSVYQYTGLLDAATIMQKFGLGSSTNFFYPAKGTTSYLGDNPQTHSFYITTRGRRINIRALATLNNSSGEFSSSIPASNIQFSLNLTPSGNVMSGVPFGVYVSSSYNYTNVTGLTLASLQSNPIVAAFNGTNVFILTDLDANIYAKSVRLDAVYTIPPFNLAQGSGHINWNVAFSFWRQ